MYRQFFIVLYFETYTRGIPRNVYLKCSTIIHFHKLCRKTELVPSIYYPDDALIDRNLFIKFLSNESIAPPWNIWNTHVFLKCFRVDIYIFPKKFNPPTTAPLFSRRLFLSPLSPNISSSERLDFDKKKKNKKTFSILSCRKFSYKTFVRIIISNNGY